MRVGLGLDRHTLFDLQHMSFFLEILAYVSSFDVVEGQIGTGSAYPLPVAAELLLAHTLKVSPWYVGSLSDLSATPWHEDAFEIAGKHIESSTIFLRNGDRYVGEYFADNIHGFVVYHIGNGQCYEGSWHEGQKKGLRCTHFEMETQNVVSGTDVSFEVDGEISRSPVFQDILKEAKSGDIGMWVARDVQKILGGLTTSSWASEKSTQKEQHRCCCRHRSPHVQCRPLPPDSRRPSKTLKTWTQKLQN